MVFGPQKESKTETILKVSYKMFTNMYSQNVQQRNFWYPNVLCECVCVCECVRVCFGRVSSVTAAIIKFHVKSFLTIWGSLSTKHSIYTKYGVALGKQRIVLLTLLGWGRLIDAVNHVSFCRLCQLGRVNSSFFYTWKIQGKKATDVKIIALWRCPLIYGRFRLLLTSNVQEKI